MVLLDIVLHICTLKLLKLSWIGDNWGRNKHGQEFQILTSYIYRYYDSLFIIFMVDNWILTSS